MKPILTLKTRSKTAISKVELFETKEGNLILHRHILSKDKWEGELQRKYRGKFLVKMEIVLTKEELKLINKALL